MSLYDEGEKWKVINNTVWKEIIIDNDRTIITTDDTNYSIVIVMNLQ